MAALPGVMSGMGSLVQAVGAIYQGQAEGAAADFNADVSTRNAAMSRVQAGEMERRARISGAKQLGAIRAAAGASGVNMEGSALDVLQESAANAELDALTIRHQGAMKAWGYEADATLNRARGGFARTAGYISATASILKGAGSMSSAGAGSGGGGGGSADGLARTG